MLRRHRPRSTTPVAALTDGELVARLLDGDEAAFDVFFARTYPSLVRFAHARLGDRDGAEEVAQETLCLAVRKLATWRGEGSLIGWLFVLARHAIGERLRAAGRAPRPMLEDDPEIAAALATLAAEAIGPEAEARRGELGRLVQVALDSLPGPYGQVLAWKYLEEVPVATIGSRLGVSAKAAESLLTRARGAFREGFATLAGELVP